MNNVLDMLTRFFDGVAKGIARVLVYLWLWIPALYCVLYGCLVIILRWDVKENVINTVFWVGFFCTVCLSVVLLVLKGPRQSKKQGQPVNLANPQPTAQQGQPPFSITNNNNQFSVVNPIDDNKKKQEEMQTPLVFASRVDPTLFVHEYHDRLMFYRKEGNNVFYLGTEFKEDNNASELA